MSTLLYRIGRNAARHPWRVIAGWVVVLGAVTALASSFGGVLTDNYTIPGTSTQRANDLLRDRFPAMSGTNARVVVHAPQGSVDQRALADASRRLSRVPHVSGVSQPELSEDGRTSMITVQYDAPITEVIGGDSLEDLKEAAQPLNAAGMQVEFGGELPESMPEPGGRAEIIGIIAAVIVLFFAFGSLLAAGLPLAVALMGLGTGVGGITLLASVTDVSPVTPTLATMVGLGVGVDYALFVVTRHRDGLSAGLPVEEAAARANASAGHAVVLAGGTVLLAITGLQFAGIPNFATMGYGTALVVLATVLAAVTLLPALLGLSKRRVMRSSTRRPADRARRSAASPPIAARLAHMVGRRPIPWLGGALIALMALATPALGMQIGQSDAGLEPRTTTIRQAYDLVAEGFGPGANGPLVVAADLRKIPPDSLPTLHEQISAQTGVAAVGSPVISPDGSAAVLVVTPTTGPQDDRTTALLESLRADVLPNGADVTGFTAAMIDVSQILTEHLWVVILVVIATSLLLLLVAFRSILIPLKAAFFNVLSVGAAFGVMTLAFQTDAGVRLLGLPGEAPIAAYVPVLMFAILFGLSMDYEVFLISRVREEYLRTNDATGSVIAGLSGTARVITSAALIMVAVFVGFAFDPAVVVKMLGVGMAAAIAIDATIIRLILVPATMALMGRASWYLPQWLDRLLPGGALPDAHGATAPRASTVATAEPAPDETLVGARPGAVTGAPG
jgi:RND superfamily putative drug exporter